MPQPALHLRFAGDSIDRWRQRPETAPFPTGDGACLAAFLHGALSPDMGYFPGAPGREISDAVHAGAGTRVARALLARHEPVLVAFGIGWLTHVIADARIHPLINAAAADLLAEEGVADPDRDHRLVAHVRVELGIEGFFAGTSCNARTPLRSVFDAQSIAPLHAILETVLAFPIALPRLLSAHHTVTAYAPVCGRLAAVLAEDLALTHAVREWGDFLRLPGVRRAASTVFPRTSPAFGFLNPVRPGAPLVEQVAAEIDAFPARLDRYLATGLRDMLDYDLDTGDVVGGPAVLTGRAATHGGHATGQYIAARKSTGG